MAFHRPVMVSLAMLTMIAQVRIAAADPLAVPEDTDTTSSTVDGGRTLGSTGQRSRALHDGFYLRFGAGFGAFGTSIEGEAADDQRTSFAPNVTFDVAVGGTPAKWFVVGGGLFTDRAPGARLRQGGTKLGRSTFEAGMLGPFIDWFPNPERGWHAGGGFGPALLIAEDPHDGSGERALVGMGGVVWFGDTFWNDGDWWMGGLVRGSQSLAWSGSGTNLSSEAKSLSLVLTALYH